MDFFAYSNLIMGKQASTLEASSQSHPQPEDCYVMLCTHFSNTERWKPFDINVVQDI